MTDTLTVHLMELAEALHDLRRRLRQAARVEVARAIGEALREASLALICGPARYPSLDRTARSDWHDAWEDPTADPWQSGGTHPEAVERGHENQEGPSYPLPPALLAGLGAARWGFVRTRQIGPAVLIGLLVALAAHAGGPAVKALLEAWSATQDLLNYSEPNSRP